MGGWQMIQSDHPGEFVRADMEGELLLCRERGAGLVAGVHGWIMPAVSTVPCDVATALQPVDWEFLAWRTVYSRVLWGWGSSERRLSGVTL